MTQQTDLASNDAQRLREQAARHRQEAVDSFERSDTDGALSQWASEINGRLYDLQARIVERGGIWDFPILLTLAGEFVPAKVIEGKYGLCWMILDKNGEATGEFAPFGSTKQAALAKRGYRQARGIRPARAVTSGGAGGFTSVYVRAIPVGSPDHTPPSEIIEPTD